MKCLVGDIVVDISTNQLGGLSTLCFLEEVCVRVYVFLDSEVLHMSFIDEESTGLIL